MTDNNTRVALTEIRAAFEDRHIGYVFPSNSLESGAFNEFCAGWHAALRAAPSLPAGDGLTDEQIMVALESRGVTFKAVYSPSLKADVISTDGSQDARDIIAGIRAVLAATRQPGDVGAGVQLQKALAFIEGIGHDLLQRRCADWYQEGANNAALQMSEDMRLLGNACADFEIGIASAQQDDETVHGPFSDADEMFRHMGLSAQQDERESPNAAPRQPGEMGAGVRQCWSSDGGYKCLNCGKGLSQHEGQRYCPAASAQQDERRTVKFPDAEGNEVSAYLTFDELAQRFRNAADELVELRAGKAAQHDEREACTCAASHCFNECDQSCKEALGYVSAIGLRNFDKGYANELTIYAQQCSIDDPEPVYRATQVQADAGAVACWRARFVDHNGPPGPWHIIEEGDVPQHRAEGYEVAPLYTRPAAESDKRDAERYRAMRAWFMREGLRAEIAPNGHIQVTTAAIVDAGVDAMSREQSGGCE